MCLYQYLNILKVYVLQITVISMISLEVKIILPVLLLRNLPDLAGLLCTKSVSLFDVFQRLINSLQGGRTQGSGAKMSLQGTSGVLLSPDSTKLSETLKCLFVLNLL